jgi:hypothetical protein
MKNLMKLSVLAILVFTLSSCATHYGFMNNSASLSEANFSYARQSISGTSQTVKILGIGGLGDASLVEKAKQNMLEEYTLQDNQALVNVTVDWRDSRIVLVKTTKCTITADIVEFNGNTRPKLITAIPIEK